MTTGFVYLNYIPAGNTGVLDSARVTDGHFFLDGSIVEPTRAYFSTFGFNGPFDNRNFTSFYIEPSPMSLFAKIGNFTGAALTGSRTEKDRQRLLSAEAPITQALEDAQKRRDKSQNDSLLAARFKIDSAFIEEHPNSYVSVDLLSQANAGWLPFSSYRRLFSLLSDSLQQSYPGQKIQREIAKETLLHPGATAIGFTTVDAAGDTISLAQYSGRKYILLDFGASWCGPCREITPLLKQESAANAPWLQVIRISHQDEVDDWRKAVASDHTGWPEIIDHGPISTAYRVDLIPALILIDKNGRIVEKYGGFYSSKPGYMAELHQRLLQISGHLQK
jgi:thiol-disulfide isomerase/thioredoxin